MCAPSSRFDEFDQNSCEVHDVLIGSPDQSGHVTPHLQITGRDSLHVKNEQIGQESEFNQVWLPVTATRNCKGPAQPLTSGVCGKSLELKSNLQAQTTSRATGNQPCRASHLVRVLFVEKVYGAGDDATGPKHQVSIKWLLSAQENSGHNDVG